MTKKVKCPTCGKEIEWNTAQAWRPFCSERCRLIDLGEWATESYRIPDTQKLPEEQLGTENKDEK